MNNLLLDHNNDLYKLCKFPIDHIFYRYSLIKLFVIRCLLLKYEVQQYWTQKSGNLIDLLSWVSIYTQDISTKQYMSNKY